MSSLQKLNEEQDFRLMALIGGEGQTTKKGQNQVGFLWGGVEHQVVQLQNESTERVSNVLAARNSFQNIGFLPGQDSENNLVSLAIGAPIKLSQATSGVIQAYQGMDPSLEHLLFLADKKKKAPFLSRVEEVQIPPQHSKKSAQTYDEGGASLGKMLGFKDKALKERYSPEAKIGEVHSKPVFVESSLGEMLISDIKSTSVLYTEKKEMSLAVWGVDVMMDIINWAATPYNKIDKGFVWTADQVCQLDLFEKKCTQLREACLVLGEKIRRWIPKSVLTSIDQKLDDLESAGLSREKINKTLNSLLNVGSYYPLLSGLKSFKLSRRISYAAGYESSKVNFLGKAKEFKGKLSANLSIVQYRLQEGTYSWWTPISEGNRLTTTKILQDRLGLLDKWGKRVEVSLAKIPKGETVRFLHGRAAPIQGFGEHKLGGGVQYRFYDFDPKWIVETKKLP